MADCGAVGYDDDDDDDDEYFSNKLIIDDENTKKITIVKEVLKSSLNLTSNNQFEKLLISNT